jgi:hypothetical protein
VADLLAQPAQANVRAAASLQLSVARAGKRLVSVGERGLVLLSDDDGRSWRQARQVPVSVALTRSASCPTAGLGRGPQRRGAAQRGRRRHLAAPARRRGRGKVAEAARGCGRQRRPRRAKHQREAEAWCRTGRTSPSWACTLPMPRGWVVGAYGLALATRMAARPGSR